MDSDKATSCSALYLFFVERWIASGTRRCRRRIICPSGLRYFDSGVQGTIYLRASRHQLVVEWSA